MTGAVKRTSLDDEILEVLDGLRLGLKRGSTVGGGVEGVLQVAIEIEFLKVLACEDGRIDQRGERDGCELEHVAGAATFERGAVLPSGGKLQTGCHRDLITGPSLGIEQNGIPAYDCEFLRGGGAGGELPLGGREEIERHVERVRALRNVN